MTDVAFPKLVSDETRRLVPKLTGELEAMAHLLLQHRPDTDCYRGERGLVARYGRPFRGAELDTDRFDFGRERECFKNAAELMLSRDGLYYCEGLAMTDRVPIAIAHAWTVDEEGRVIDTTWRPEDADPETWEYLGIVFDRKWLFNRLLDTGEYGLLDHPDFWLGHELPDEALDRDWYREEE